MALPRSHVYVLLCCIQLFVVTSHRGDDLPDGEGHLAFEEAPFEDVDFQEPQVGASRHVRSRLNALGAGRTHSRSSFGSQIDGKMVPRRMSGAVANSKTIARMTSLMQENADNFILNEDSDPSLENSDTVAAPDGEVGPGDAKTNGRKELVQELLDSAKEDLDAVHSGDTQRGDTQATSRAQTPSTSNDVKDQKQQIESSEKDAEIPEESLDEARRPAQANNEELERSDGRKEREEASDDGERDGQITAAEMPKSLIHEPTSTVKGAKAVESADEITKPGALMKTADNTILAAERANERARLAANVAQVAEDKAVLKAKADEQDERAKLDAENARVAKEEAALAVGKADEILKQAIDVKTELDLAQPSLRSAEISSTGRRSKLLGKTRSVSRKPGDIPNVIPSRPWVRSVPWSDDGAASSSVGHVARSSTPGSVHAKQDTPAVVKEKMSSRIDDPDEASRLPGSPNDPSHTSDTDGKQVTPAEADEKATKTASADDAHNEAASLSKGPSDLSRTSESHSMAAADSSRADDRGGEQIIPAEADEKATKPAFTDDAQDEAASLSESPSDSSRTSKSHSMATADSSHAADMDSKQDIPRVDGVQELAKTLSRSLSDSSVSLSIAADESHGVGVDGKETTKQDTEDIQVTQNYTEVLLSEYGREGAIIDSKMLARRSRADELVTDLVGGILLVGLFIVGLVSYMLTHSSFAIRIYSHKLMSSICSTFTAMTFVGVLKTFCSVFEPKLSSFSDKWGSFVLYLCTGSVFLVWYFGASIASIRLRSLYLDSFVMVNLLVMISAFISIAAFGHSQQYLVEYLFEVKIANAKELGYTFVQANMGSSVTDPSTEQSIPDVSYFALLVVYVVMPMFVLATFQISSCITDRYRDSCRLSIIREQRSQSVDLGFGAMMQDDASGEEKTHDDMTYINRRMTLAEMQASAVAVGFMAKQLVVFLITRRIVPMGCQNPVRCYSPRDDLYMFIFPILFVYALLVCMAVVQSQLLADHYCLNCAMLHGGMSLTWTMLECVSRCVEHVIWHSALPTSALHSETVQMLCIAAILSFVYVLAVVLLYILVEREIVGHTYTEGTLACIGLVIGSVWQRPLADSFKQISGIMPNVKVYSEPQITTYLTLSLCALGITMMLWRFLIAPTAVQDVPEPQREIDASNVPTIMRGLLRSRAQLRKKVRSTTQPASDGEGYGSGKALGSSADAFVQLKPVPLTGRL
eukprot:TRINITY_DN15983_c0_g2_i1.p1 TRINITY_DN15983_c0_g2~~TRINITY_DN15983_c0_g2_i1.p1  ORF type:complete len:1218 (+),score=128.54 TRINITY_DN15983_c0_g2_i1:86-3739(+)